MLIPILFLLAQTLTPSAAQRPGNLSQDMFYASRSASGSELCSRTQAARYARQFNARFGERIRALTRYHEARFGKDPDFIYTSGCRFSRAPRWRQNRDHARAMDAFEPVLRDLERRYGPPG